RACAERRVRLAEAGRPLARGPAGGERQPAPRRSVLRRAHARPESALAAASLEPRPLDARDGALAHRCEHAPGAGTRRRLRHAGRQPAAAQAAVAVKLSISQITTVTQSFADDVDTYVAAGADGIGIWEMKLEDDSLERFRASGLGAAAVGAAGAPMLPLPPSVGAR